MVEEKQKDTRDLEDKLDILGRLKYMALPLAAAAGAYFTPEFKAKYDSLPRDTRDKYKIMALTGVVLIGSVMSMSSGYTLYKLRQKDNETISDIQ